MSSTLAEAQADLLKLLASLSPGDDPYAAVATYLRDQIFPTVPYSAICQLYLLAAALGLATILILTSLFIRWRKGGFWLLRMQQTPRMVRPHWSVSWNLIAVVMLVLFEVFVGYATEYYRKEANERFGFWGVAWWGGQTAAWSLGVSYTLHEFASTGRSLSFLSSCSNVFGLVVPVVYFGVVLPLVIIGGTAYSGMIGHYRAADELLARASTAWKPGERVNILSLAPAMPILERLVARYETFQVYFRVLFIWYGVTAVVLVICLVSIASIYLTSLRRVLSTTRHELASTSGSSTFIRRPQQAQVARTLRSLLLTIIAFSFLGTAFSLDAMLAASDPRALASNSLRAQILILLPLYAFAVFGLPCAVLLVLNARDATAAEDSNSGSHSYSARARNLGHGAFGSGDRATGFKGSRGRAGVDEGIDVTSAGQQFSIQLAHLDSNEPFPPPAFSSVAGGGDGAGAQGGLGGVKVAVNVDVVVDEDDEVEDEKFDLRRSTTRGADV
ncbi:uncharacterized protein RHOBADRAFT_53194 [Rhodotorula graminis WP1]|uniref:Proteophosphoglycan ppg4 n=1 Tax=Rhodotorula graminis (strain WP1) TaxID=578459 RepID=A0A194S6Y9_RHOGW|nr:uncharacterized protein RHOBADRAFT_53194 [Rhodotorula graminis WP1]KPV75181.1 hypothetical protein RHOBADRAFT_53194 [Rhodotorula graminis WP1]